MNWIYVLACAIVYPFSAGPSEILLCLSPLKGEREHYVSALMNHWKVIHPNEA